MSTNERITQEIQDDLRRRVRGPLPANCTLIADQFIPMRDGVRLCCDVYQPTGAQALPVILSIAPYIKELQLQPALLTHSIEAGPTDTFIASGYVHVIATHRGAGLSQGQYDHISAKEQADFFDVIEWISHQPWCNGAVGMVGDSHFAVNSLWATTQQHPALKCVVPYDAMSDFYRDFAYPGGAYRSSFLSKWYIDSMHQFAWPGPVEGRMAPANQLQDFIDNPFDGPYWWERSLRTQLDRIKTPVLHMVPTSPVHTRGQLSAYSLGKYTKKLVITPRPENSKEHWLFLKSEPLKAYMLRFLDHWLKGKATGIMDEPEVAICDSGTGEWRHENEYPLARTQWTPYYLNGSAEGGREGHVGSITTSSPTHEAAADSFQMPDWDLVAAGKPVLSYTSAPMEKPLRVYGPLSAVLYASTTAHDTVLFVKLFDIASDGTSMPLSDGVLKASFRELDPALSRPGLPWHPYTRRDMPESGKVYEYQIELRPIFHTFTPGHRLSVYIQSNDPAFMNFLHTVYNTEMLPYPATNRVYRTQQHASHLLLPVIPDAAEIAPVAAPLSDVVWPIQGLVW